MLCMNLILQADMIVVNPSTWSMMPVHDWYDFMPPFETKPLICKIDSR